MSTRVRLYVAAVVAAAAAVATLTALTVPGWREPSLAVSALLAVLVAVAESLQIRYHHHDTVDALVLLEGTFAPVLFAASGARGVAIIAAGLLAGELVRRNEPTKRLFNVAQWVLAASAGMLVWHLVAAPQDSSVRAVGGLMLALLAVVVCNQVLISGVLYVATGSPLGSGRRGDAWSVIYGRAASFAGAMVLGVLITGAYLWHPWTAPLAVVPLLFLWQAGRAQASVRADHRRLAGLQAATHALASSLDAAKAFPLFLAECRIGFDASCVQLVLFGEERATVHTCDGRDPSGYSVGYHRHVLAERLASVTAQPMHVTPDFQDGPVGDALALGGYQRAIAVPLQVGAASIGMLLIYDRQGIEGFEAGELAVAAALGREVVGFMERADLLRAVDEERRKLADILQHTSDGILTVDASGAVTSWNNGLAAMTGYTADEMVGSKHLALLRPRDGHGRDVLIERWHGETGAGTQLPAELQIVSAIGATVWLSCSYSRIPAAEGQSDVLVVVARNITKVRELDQLKDDFVAVVSHELRTPLVPIKGWAQTLLHRGDRLSDDQRRTAVQSILAQAQKLESLVLNILESSRIEAGLGSVDGSADVIAVVLRLVEDTLAARPDRVINVTPPNVPCQVHGSPVWIERAVANLVGNALKYSADEQPVDVVVSVDDRDVLVAVTDRGPGIAAESRERVFERFERLEETSKQTGTGLGLYITRRLARAMGGDVTVSSMPGAGSTFVLRLPLALPARLPRQRPAVRDAADDKVVHLR